MNLQTLKISNPRSADPTGYIDVTLIATDGSEMAFTSTPGDSEIYGQEIYRRAFTGEFGTVQILIKDEAAEKQAAAEVKKAALIRAASLKIEMLQDAVNLGMATDDENNMLRQWQAYRVMLDRVNTSSPDDIQWPELPDAPAQE